MEFEISIPTDTDGFVLLQCPKCKEFFKLTPNDIESEDTLDIYCPFCGMTSEHYVTNDVIELSQVIAQNQLMEYVHNEFKKLERKNKSKNVQIKAGKKPKLEYENKITSKIDDLIISKTTCCKKEVKLNYLTEMCGYYCPYCGVRNDGNK